ncbi:hypothetical protein, partial [Leifsonia sp. SIMBA_070]|uniref:hypothetical protein n=1 Tax=Leifsonia sp. SIMBA_070 TaxID=3085810 RepID=UPI00397C687D
RHALWLDQGRVAGYGDVFDVTQSYLAWHERKDARDTSGVGRNSNAPYRIHALEVGEGEGDPVMACGEPLDLRLELSAPDGRPPV